MAQPPAGSEEPEHPNVAETVQGTDSLGSRSVWNRHPVDHPERRGEDSADDPGPDGRGRDRAPDIIACDAMSHVEGDRSGEQPERERDQHWVNGMPEKFCPGFHRRPLATRG